MGIALACAYFAGCGGAASVFCSSLSGPMVRWFALLPVLPFCTAAPAERELHPGCNACASSETQCLKLEETSRRSGGVHRL